MLVLLIMLLVASFSIYLAIEAMKYGMCEKKWFFAAMCLGPIVWPMFNAQRQMHLRKNIGNNEVSVKV